MAVIGRSAVSKEQRRELTAGDGAVLRSGRLVPRQCLEQYKVLLHAGGE